MKILKFILTILLSVLIFYSSGCSVRKYSPEPAISIIPESKSPEPDTTDKSALVNEPVEIISNEQNGIIGKYFEEYTYAYGVIERSDSLFKPQYIPWIELRDDNTFTFCLNMLAGMADVYGRWGLSDDGNSIYMYAEEGSESKTLGRFYLEIASETELVYHGENLVTLCDGNTYRKVIESGHDLNAGYGNVNGHTVGNLNNDPWVAQDGDWIYFCSTLGFYKVHKDGGEIIRVSSNDGTTLNVVDDWIYFRNMKNNAYFSLCRVRTDGSDMEILDPNPVYYPVISDGWVYYTREDYDKANSYYIKYLCKMRTDGSQMSVIGDMDAAYMNIVDGWIYFSNRSSSDYASIYKMSLYGNEIIQLNKDKSYYVYVLDGWIYYINDSDYGKLYKMRIDGSQQTAIDQTNNVKCFNVVDNWIYFAVSRNIYKISVEGGDIIKIPTKEAADRIIILGEWNYYRNYQRIRLDGTSDWPFGAYRGAGEWN